MLRKLQIRLTLVSVIILSFFISSCATLEVIRFQQSGQKEQQLEKQNEELALKVEQLQQKLLKKQAEINKLVFSRQHIAQEAHRSRAKLRSNMGKAETVANIAEARTAIKSVSEKPLTEQQRSLVHEAEQMIVMSVDALGENDVNSAFRLSNRSKQLVQSIHSLNETGKDREDVVLIAPQTMRVLVDCNVRKAPGMTKVLFTLKRAVEVKSLAYTPKWIKIETDDGRRGWIYYQLLEIIQ